MLTATKQTPLEYLALAFFQNDTGFNSARGLGESCCQPVTTTLKWTEEGLDSPWQRPGFLAQWAKGVSLPPLHTSVAKQSWLLPVGSAKPSGQGSAMPKGSKGQAWALWTKEPGSGEAKVVMQMPSNRLLGCSKGTFSQLSVPLPGFHHPTFPLLEASRRKAEESTDFPNISPMKIRNMLRGPPPTILIPQSTA